MSSESTYAGAYQKEELIEHCTYSTLFVGKKGDARQAVLVRHWLTAHAVTLREQTRMQTEVAALRAVRHPHLLPVLEVSATDQGIFLVSAWAPGGVLSTRLARHIAEPFPLDEALLLITQVGQALAVLHQQGIVHGNLNPHAIFFDTPGHAYLGECRLAGILACIPDYQPALDEGTPRCWYMAPEQFSGVSDASTDQYALGCLAYQLLSGRVPFAGSARATLRQKHLQDLPRPLSERHPALPAYLDQVVLKALAKQPAERYPDTQAFLDALGQSRRDALSAQKTGEQPVLDAVWTGAPGAQELPGTSYTQETPGADGKKVPTSSLPRQSGGTRSRPALPSPSWRGRLVLASAALIVLALFSLAGRGLVFPGAHTRQTTGQPTTTASQLAQTSTPGTGQTAAAVHGSPTLALDPTPFPGASPTATSVRVVPLLDCVMPAGGTAVAEFGYQNPNASAVTIPPGAQNMLTPANANGSAPTSFAPGFHHRVFQVSFFKHGSVSWSLNGMTVVAKSNSPQC
jgi:serine/threonine protein kinase